MKKQVKKVAKKVAKLSHKLGDRFAVNDVFCEVRFVNAGTGFLFPLVDDLEDDHVRKHIAYGKITDTGAVIKI